jgi:S-adenosylmethionine:tRNA ribosyltransferase-isomerase
VKAAAWPRDNALAERLMVLDPRAGSLTHATVGELGRWLRAGDLLVVNDAATVPASLRGATARGEPVELRLAGATDDSARWTAVVFGAGDWRTRTEHRPAPPCVAVGEAIALGESLRAVVEARSPLSERLVTVRLEARGGRLWEALYAHGRPVQYAHVADELPLWHVQTAYAGRPWAVELPSAGRPLRWSLLASLPTRGVELARVTHAAGLSATGDDALDARLPLPERYDIPAETVAAVERARARGGRVVAVGTSVVRALEGCARDRGALTAGDGVTDLRIGAGYAPRVVDAVLSGMHEPGTSHFQLLTAFAPAQLLVDATAAGSARGYLQHEFGDACLVMAA